THQQPPRDLIRFQKQQGLTADGIVGPQTWSKLID
ncbi:MAG: peptidoglycan-binding protein, partial [Moorea sp. SIO3I7]|nr:peptidoglycan-binding protein [Moorena sp. SIO3I7]